MRYESFTYPPYQAPLIEAYEGRFEAVFIALHPFVRVPAELAWKTTPTYPGDEEILARGTKCPWAEVAAQTGLNNCAKLNRALLTSIGSLDEHLRDPEGRNALKYFLEAEPVWMPTEGRFEPLLRGDILAAFEAAGQEEVMFVPEFPAADAVERLKVADLKSRAKAFPERGSLVAEDGSFLFTGGLGQLLHALLRIAQIRRRGGSQAQPGRLFCGRDAGALLVQLLDGLRYGDPFAGALASGGVTAPIRRAGPAFSAGMRMPCKMTRAPSL